MDLSIYQRYFIQSLLLENKIQNYIDAFKEFKRIFDNKTFKITQDYFKKIKMIL